MSNQILAVPEELRALPTERQCGIYCIRNKTNSKIYVGSSNDIWRRIKYHIRNLKLNKHFNRHLQSAWNKYGETVFDFSILEIVLSDKEKLIKREQFYMDTLSAHHSGYNSRPFANNNTGVIFSEEYRTKMSKIKKGFKHTEETKIKMRVKRPKMSLSMKGNKRRLGYKYSETDKLKLIEQVRKKDKWPCDLGSRCKCENCLIKKRIYYKEQRQKHKASK